MPYKQKRIACTQGNNARKSPPVDSPKRTGTIVVVRWMEPPMSEIEATAEVFYTALKALSKSERDAVLARIANEKSWARDLVDLATIAQRRHEPSRSFRTFLSAKRTKK